MIKSLEWESLQDRRTKARLTMLYKINNDLKKVPKDMLTQSDGRTRGKHKFRQVYSNKNIY